MDVFFGCVANSEELVWTFSMQARLPFILAVMLLRYCNNLD